MDSDAPGFFRGKRLVVFGAGYVGGAVVREALVRGLRVVALTRNTATAAPLAAAGADVVVDDLAKDTWHARITGPFDFVLNSVSSGGGGLAAYRHGYVRGMESILAWAGARGGLGSMVYTSSTSVYPQSGGVVVDENAATEGGGETAQLLLEAEELLRSHGPALARRFVLRLAGIYGPGRHQLLDQLRAGVTEIGGRGDHTLNLIHRDDIVSAIWAAFGAPSSLTNETFNVADDGAGPKADLVFWLAQQLGRPQPVFSGVATAGRRAVTPDRTISNGKLKRMLRWQPQFPDFRAGYAPLLEA